MNEDITARLEALRLAQVRSFDCKNLMDNAASIYAWMTGTEKSAEETRWENHIRNEKVMREAREMRCGAGGPQSDDFGGAGMTSDKQAAATAKLAGMITFEQWREAQHWYIASKDDGHDPEAGVTHRLMNIAASGLWDAAVLAERERCAAICDREHIGGTRDNDLGWTSCAATLAAAIRNQGDTGS